MEIKVRDLYYGNTKETNLDALIYNKSVYYGDERIDEVSNKVNTLISLFESYLSLQPEDTIMTVLVDSGLLIKDELISIKK